MRYRIKAGALYAETGGEPLARVEGRFCTREKQILDGGGRLVLRTAIHRTREDPAAGCVYRMEEPSGACYAQAWPDWAPREAAGAPPLNRMPKVDHARLGLGEREYLLIMQSSRTYGLLTLNGKKAVQIDHCGVAGGWQVETWQDFTPPFLCGLFVFCRYLERENELLIV